MNRTLRGLWSRRTSLSALFLTTAVVIAGLVTTTGMAEHAGTSRMVSGALFLLGLVAVPFAGSLLASARREEVGVTRLRGQYGDDLVRHLSAEPAIAIAGGAVVGYLLGLAGVWLTTSLWLDESHVWPGIPATITCVVVVVVALVAAMLGMARVIREPLSQQVAVAERPRATTTLGIFGAVMTIVAAAVVAYRSQVTAGDPDGVVLLGPALIGLAAGQVAVWLLHLLSRIGARRTAGSGLPAYLAFRRLRGTGGLTASVRLLTAALVVGVVAVSGARDVDDWADETATFDAVGGYRIPVDLSGVQALTLTRRLDPEGRWLMAAGYDFGQYDEGRRAFLDFSRFPRVADGFERTSAADLTRVAGGMQTADLQITTGGRISVTVAGAPRDRDPSTLPMSVRVTLRYVSSEGTSQNAALVIAVPAPGEEVTETAPLPGCVEGCSVNGVSIEGGGVFDDFGFQTPLTVFFDDGPFDLRPVLVPEIRVGQEDLGTLAWRVEGDGGTGLFNEAGFGYDPEHEDGTVAFAPVGGRGALNIVRAGDLDPRDSIETLGGLDRKARTVGEFDALPLVRGAGLVGDLVSSLVADQPPVPSAEMFVIARADTPQQLLDSVVAEVAEDGGADALVETRAAVEAEVTRSSGAFQAHSYLLLALACLLLALVALASAVAAQRRTYAREVAALRVIGVPIRDQRRAGRIELLLLGATSLLVGLGAGLLATELLLPGLPILRTSLTSVPFEPAAEPVAVALLALATALLVALVGGRGRQVDAASSLPALLREEEG